MRIVSAAMIAVAAFACGEPTEAPLAVELGFQSQALLTGLSRIRVQLNPGDIPCDVLALSGPELEAVYRLDIPVRLGQLQAEGTIFDVVEDEYTPNAWGFGAANAVRAYGCSAPVTVERGRLAEVSIEMDPIRGF